MAVYGSGVPGVVQRTGAEASDSSAAGASRPSAVNQKGAALMRLGEYGAALCKLAASSAVCAEPVRRLATDRSRVA